MNNLAVVYLMELEVGVNYAICLVLSYPLYLFCCTVSSFTFFLFNINIDYLNSSLYQIQTDPL